MSKQDLYPPKPTLVGTDYVTGVDSTGPSTIKILISAILNFVWTLANIPAGGTSPITRDNESQVAFIVNNTGVWTGDALGSTLLASMTAATVYINGRRIIIAVVAHRAFTASKDTYIDVLDNGDGTGTLVYTTVTNNAAAPALASNSARIGRINAGATNIAASSSIIQYGLDSLGNYIYNISATAAPTTIYANPGTAGGTFYYKNQSGVKEFWGITNTYGPLGASSPTTGSLSVTLPTSFYNLLTTILVSVGALGSTNYLFANLLGSSTSALTIELCQVSGGNGTAPIDVLVRGY